MMMTALANDRKMEVDFGLIL